MSRVHLEISGNGRHHILGNRVYDEDIVYSLWRHKVVKNFTALKNTIGEIIPGGYEPWSEFRPDEEVSTIIASNSILKRMTPSILLTGLGNKTLIELKRSLKEIFESDL